MARPTTLEFIAETDQLRTPLVPLRLRLSYESLIEQAQHISLAFSSVLVHLSIRVMTRGTDVRRCLEHCEGRISSIAEP